MKRAPRLGRLAWALGLCVPAFLLMCTDVHFAASVPLVFVVVVAVACALLDALGTFDDPPADAAPGVTLRGLLPRLIELAGSAVALIAALRLAVAGVLPLPIVSAALLVTVGTAWVVVAGYRVLEGLGATGERRLLQRHGFWLFVANLVLYVPLLGSFSLSDPWETHYGEVAREMLARDDWISLWWAQDGWFWSKPVLDFWLQGISFSLLGVEFMPDQLLAGAGSGRLPQPEWAARLPVVVLTMIASWVLYRGIATSFGRRAGLIGGLCLTSMPYWYLLAHQSMTDMPYVAPLATALGLLLLGLQTDPEQSVRSYALQIGRRSITLSVRHLVLGLIVVSVVPQVLYLASRHLTLQLSAPPYLFRWHLDEFFSGSGGGNCGLPGNAACHSERPLDPIFQPGLGALLWSVVLGVLLWTNREERRAQRLYFLAAWYFVALSAMGKGAPGLVLPLAIAGAWLGATRRFCDFTRLELPAMVLIVACVALPWYVQMYARHGSPFTDRLLIHDMYKRAFSHVHDTNAGDDTSFRYYVWQLGYGLFPWTGIAAGSLLFWQRHGDEAKDRRAETLSLLALWIVVVFGMFSVTKTKFHHYILPAVPAFGMLAGLVLDRALSTPLFAPRRLLPYLASLGASALLFVYGLHRLFPGSVLGDVTDASRHGPLDWTIAAISLVLALALAWLGARRFGPGASLTAEEESLDGWLVAVIGFVGAIVVLLVGRDLFTTLELNGAIRLMHLFTYNYKRPWPTTLAFETTLKAFTVAAALVSAALVLPRLRSHAAVALVSIGLLSAAWGVNVYLYRLSPHWGQRENLLAYYRHRKGPEQPIVAYQMNWKGENFYTGNRLPAFVQSGAKFKSWIKEQRDKGVKVMFFTTEHSRMTSLKNELGNVKKFQPITTAAENNKFFVARVEF